MSSKMKVPPSKRIFDTENALKGAFNGRTGKWQLLAYAFFVLAFAIITGWINKLLNYNLLGAANEQAVCDQFEITYKNNKSRSIIKRLNGLSKYEYFDSNNKSEFLEYNYKKSYGETVVTEFNLYCDLLKFSYLPHYVNQLGLAIGALLLGYLADKGGRKIILLGCIWVTGIISLFQVVGKDFISYVFFQLFLGIFSGGVHVVFVPIIIEMFPIDLRTFYGVFFHLIVSAFQVVLPLIGKGLLNWSQLQFTVTVPLVLTAPLQWVAFESIFWYLAHKEYDKAIKTLTKLAKRNGILFESKFKEAKEFLHAKHSKATQVDILPLLRLKDVEQLGKKYPTVDMSELQKQKLNDSKLRRFLNSLKGNHYRSTNTIYYPYDFIFSPTLLAYVFILCGLWFTMGLSESIERIKIKMPNLDFFYGECILNLVLVGSSVCAVLLSLLKVSRRWVIFTAYFVMEICLLGSLIAKYSKNPETNKPDEKIQVALSALYLTCKFASNFGFIYLMIMTAELFPTSLRCTGMGICLVMKLLGSLIASENLLNYNTEMHRLAYGLLALVFAAFAIFLPETRKNPLPRCILQIEAMQSTLGKRLQSVKVKIACEQRNRQQSARLNDSKNMTDEIALLPTTNPKASNPNEKKTESKNRSAHYAQYDTVSSVHDIEQDDMNFDYNEQYHKLQNIVEVPSKNITRNNSIVEASDMANSKV